MKKKHLKILELVVAFASIIGLGLFANIRPAKLFSQLKDACPLKPEIIGDGFDIVMMR